MTVVGVGTDVVDVSRIQRLLTRTGTAFLQRWFRPQEVSSCLARGDAASAASGLLAAKESVVKALGAGGRISPPWQDIEIVTGPGRPSVVLHGELGALAVASSVQAWHLSITDHGDYALAVAIATTG